MATADRPDATYLALADDIERDILRLAAGTRLPSENDLAAKHGVSRLTARAALQELEQRLLVRRSRGSGTYIALRLTYPIRGGDQPSWSRLVSAAGHDPTFELLEVDTMRASAAVAAKLEISRGRTVAQLRRRGFVDGEVAMVQTHWFPVDLVPDLGRHHHGDEPLSTTLRQGYQIVTTRAWSRVELIPAPPDVAPLLDQVGRPPTWRVENVNRLAAADRAVEYSIGWMRADSFRVVLELDEATAPTPAPTTATNGTGVTHPTPSSDHATTECP